MGFLTSLAGGLGGTGLGSAVVTLAVDAAPLEAGLAKAKADVTASTGGMAASTKAISTGFIVAGAAAVLAMGKAVSATENLGQSTFTLQRITGQSAESASALLFVMDKMGLSAQAAQQSFGILSKNIDNNAKVLTTYHLQLTNTDGTMKDFNTILGIAADKYVALGGGLQGAAFAQELFGRSGKALIPILNLGASGISALEAEAQKYGLVLSQGTVNQVRALYIAQQDLHASFQGLAVAVGTDLVPIVTSFTKDLTKLVLAFQLIPAPVIDIGLGFVAFTGAILLTQKAATLLNAAWGQLVAGIVGSTAAEEVAGPVYVQTSLEIDAAATAVEGAGIAMSAAIPVIGIFVAALGAVVLIGGQMADQIGQMADQIFTQVEALQLAAHDHITYAAALAKVVAQQKAAAAAGGDYNQILEAQKAALQSLVPTVLSIIGDNQGLIAAQRQLAKDLNHSAGAATIAADKLAVLNAEFQKQQDLKTYATNLSNAGKSAQFITTKLEALGAKAGLSKTEVDKLLASLNLLDGKTVNININTHYTDTHRRLP